MVCLRYISIDTLHKGDTEENNNNNYYYIYCLLMYLSVLRKVRKKYLGRVESYVRSLTNHKIVVAFHSLSRQRRDDTF